MAQGGKEEENGKRKKRKKDMQQTNIQTHTNNKEPYATTSMDCMIESNNTITPLRKKDISAYFVTQSKKSLATTASGASVSTRSRKIAGSSKVRFSSTQCKKSSGSTTSKKSIKSAGSTTTKLSTKSAGSFKWKDDNTALLKCDICSSEFKRKDVLDRHMKSHDDTALLKCDICSSEFFLRIESF
jgi:hypothetical protein